MHLEFVAVCLLCRRRALPRNLHTNWLSIPISSQYKILILINFHSLFHNTWIEAVGVSSTNDCNGVQCTYVENWKWPTGEINHFSSAIKNKRIQGSRICIVYFKHWINCISRSPFNLQRANTIVLKVTWIHSHGADEKGKEWDTTTECNFPMF